MDRNNHHFKLEIVSDQKKKKTKNQQTHAHTHTKLVWLSLWVLRKAFRMEERLLVGLFIWLLINEIHKIAHLEIYSETTHWHLWGSFNPEPWAYDFPLSTYQALLS